MGVCIVEIMAGLWEISFNRMLKTETNLQWAEEHRKYQRVKTKCEPFFTKKEERKVDGKSYRV